MVAAGPSPGSTPMTMPMSTPIRQYSRFFGSTTRANPSRNALKSMAFRRRFRMRSGAAAGSAARRGTGSRRRRRSATLITTVLRQLSPPRNRSQITHSTSAGISKPVNGISRPKATKVTAPIHRQQTAAGERLAVGQPAADHEQDRRQRGDEHADDERPQPGPGSLQRPEPVAVGQHRAGDTDRDPDQRADRSDRRVRPRAGVPPPTRGRPRPRSRRGCRGCAGVRRLSLGTSAQPSLRRLMPYCLTRSA